MFIDFQTTSKPMTLSKLPLWQTPEQVCDILLALPEKQRNRALYELVFLFDHENPQGRTEAESQLAALRLLWHDPRFQALENIRHWLRDVLGLDELNGSWFALQDDIETLMEMLHPETCRTYGEYGGMFKSAQTLEPFVARMFDRNTEASRSMAWDCLYWNKELRRLRPDWDEWLKEEIRNLRDKYGENK